MAGIDPLKMTVDIGGVKYDVDLKYPLDISIPVRFGEQQVSAFGSPPAKREAYHAGAFTGDVRHGGSCNCDVYTFSPHLHGTHTECIGHITVERKSVCDIMKDAFIPATLVTVTPETNAKDAYSPPLRQQDKAITKAMLEKSIVKGAFLSALIVRTIPNTAGKLSCDYIKDAPPFFTNDAMRYIAALGVSHLIVDFPSVDRPDDEGKLSNHRIFWDAPHKTITELIYAQKDIADGQYLLNLQIAAMEGDAASSRPLLFRVKKS